MRVLVACEFSGIVRDAFLARGHDAMSADLLPTERPGPHHEGDVTPLLREPWDMVIAHPPCTYLANSGVRWLHEDATRWPKLDEAAAFFRACLDANAPRVAVENPVMHSHGRERVGRGPDFTVQPYEFGHDVSKRTCFWTRGLPLLLPIAIGINTGSKWHDESWNLPPTERAHYRSRTFQGIADAMADQWGSLTER